MSDSNRIELTRRDLVGSAAAAGLVMTGSPLLATARRDTPFSLIRADIPTTIMIDDAADLAVRHVARAFAEDLGRVGGTAGNVTIHGTGAISGEAVIIGVLGQSALLDQLVAAGKITRVLVDVERFMAKCCTA